MAKYTKYILTEFDLKKLKKKIAQDVVLKAFLIVSAFLMEEPEFNYDADKICEFWDKITAWSDAIDEHIISLRKVAAIVNEHCNGELEIKI